MVRWTPNPMYLIYWCPSKKRKCTDAEGAVGVQTPGERMLHEAEAGTEGTRSLRVALAEDCLLPPGAPEAS